MEAVQTGVDGILFLSLALLKRIAGPACGACFKLTLVNPVVANPPFYPSEKKEIVVKIVDLCPLSQAGWCSGTANRTNS